MSSIAIHYSNSLNCECIDEETIYKTIYNMQLKINCRYNVICSQLLKLVKQTCGDKIINTNYKPNIIYMYIPR